MSSKTFEALDFMRFALPNVWEIDTRLTAANPELLSFLQGRGWGSYGPLWKRMPRIWKHALSDSEISSWWKTGWLIDGMKALRDEYKGEGNWYPISQEVRYVGGIKLRTSIRGVLFTQNYGPEVHVINPRKSQTIDNRALGFLARAAYEEYAIDDPNLPKVAVLDMGSKKRGKVRDIKMYRGEVVEMMPVEHFEYSVNAFLEALVIADRLSFQKVTPVQVGMLRLPR